ncbi:DUF6492 family protein [Teichococcus aestuarii]|uniref:DUF6492 family protein n=1 Tax=Teichococcus aestuarii TaxID=568898 RepID=UPI0011B1F748|nr:DUF6492 family protein [Pseudoroseomonas aestuarii]
MSKVTFVSIVYDEEAALLGLQAASLSKFFYDKDISSIIVIVNQENFESFSKKFYSKTIFYYGNLLSKVTLLDAGCLFPYGAGKYDRNPGYYKQQICKLYAAKIVKDDHYICLDAKNFFVAPASAEDFFYNSIPNSYFELYKSDPPSIQRMGSAEYSKFFGIADLENHEPGMAIMTPFAFHKDIVLDLIKFFELAGNPIESKFSSFTRRSEFLLYFTYMRYKKIDFSSRYCVTRTPLSKTFWPDQNFSRRSFFNSIKSMNEKNQKIVGLHKNTLVNSNVEEIFCLRKYLIDIGISQEACDDFYIFASEIIRGSVAGL